jgi:hypothetical protein
MKKPKVKLGKDFNPGEARWCDDHTRLECTGMSRQSGRECHAPALRGTNRCGIHSGGKRIARAKGAAKISAWSALGEAARSVSASTAVMAMLQQSWLRAAIYGEMLRRQVVTDGEAGSGIETGDAEAEGAPDVPGGTGGLVGYRYGMGGKEGILYRQGEAARELVQLEAAERDRVVKYAKTAHDMGISDRMTALAERWGEEVVSRIMLIMDNLGLTPEQEMKVPALVQAHLASIDLEGGGSDVIEGKVIR